MKNMHFLAAAMSVGNIWAITPHVFESLQSLLASKQGLAEAAEQDERTLAVQRIPLVRNTGKTVGLVTFHGIVINRCPSWATYYGYMNPQEFAAEVRKLADDPTVASIVISVDSPGGTVAGTVEAADAVAYARSRKRITAVVNDMACSAAYWVSAQANEIVVSPTALTGSIGCLISHVDYTKMLTGLGILVTYIRSAAKKALGQPYEPLSDEAKAEFQAMVDAVHQQFVNAVAKGRRKSRDAVSKWATGEVWTGAEAVAAGLADRVGTMNTVLGELTGAIAPPEPSPPPDPEDDQADPPDDSEDPEARASPPLAANSAPPDAVQNPSPTEDPPAHPETGSSITPSSAPTAQEASMKIEDILAKVQDGQALTAEERAFLNQHLDAQGTSASSTVDLSQLSPEARAALEKAQADATAAQARAERAEQTANTERDQRLNREFAERAAALGQPAAFGATLREASEKLTPEAYAALEQSLNASAAQAGLLQASGSAQDRRDSGNAKADYQTRVEQTMKDNPGMSRADAGRKVLAADPEFAKRYQRG